MYLQDGTFKMRAMRDNRKQIFVYDFHLREGEGFEYIAGAVSWTSLHEAGEWGIEIKGQATRGGTVCGTANGTTKNESSPESEPVHRGFGNDRGTSCPGRLEHFRFQRSKRAVQM